MPIAPAVGAALITAGSQFGNMAAQGSMNRKSRKWQEKMYARQRADALADWNMQNEYNSPAAQMARFKEAGLNPHLVYGQGAGNANAGPVRSSSPGNWSPKAPQFDSGSVLGAYFDTEIKGLQTEIMTKQKEVMAYDMYVKNSQALKNLSEVDRNKLGIRKGEFDLALSQALAGFRIEAADLANKKTQASIDKLGVDMDYTKAAQIRQDALAASSIKEAASRIYKNYQDVLESRARVEKNAVERQLIQHQIVNTQQAYSNMVTSGLIAELDREAKRLGITPNDPWYIRMIGRLINWMSGKEAPPSDPWNTVPGSENLPVMKR